MWVGVHGIVSGLNDSSSPVLLALLIGTLSLTPSPSHGDVLILARLGAESWQHYVAGSPLTSQKYSFRSLLSGRFSHKLPYPSHQILSESGWRGGRAETNEGDIFTGLNMIQGSTQK